MSLEPGGREHSQEEPRTAAADFSSMRRKCLLTGGPPTFLVIQKPRRKGGASQAEMGAGYFRKHSALDLGSTAPRSL